MSFYVTEIASILVRDSDASLFMRLLVTWLYQLISTFAGRVHFLSAVVILYWSVQDSTRKRYVFWDRQSQFKLPIRFDPSDLNGYRATRLRLSLVAAVACRWCQSLTRQLELVKETKKEMRTKAIFSPLGYSTWARFVVGDLHFGP